MLSTLLRLLAPSASAQVPCGQGMAFQLPGCGQTAENVIATTIIPNLAIFGIRVATLLSLLFIIIAGISLMLSSEDGARSTAKKGILYSMGGLLLSLGAGIIVSFVANEEFGQSLPAASLLFGGLLGGAIRILLTVSNVVLIFIIMYQGVLMLMAQGKSDQFNTARSTLFWAVIGAVVVNIARVLVNIVLALQL